MSLWKLWVCDRCSGREETDPMQEFVLHGDDGLDHPPAGWAVVQPPLVAPERPVLLCGHCTAAVREFIESKPVAA